MNTSSQQTPADSEILSYFETLSNWGRWGPDDQVGTLNLITPEKRVAAAGLVKSGITVSCSRTISPRHDVDNPTPLLHFMISSGESAPPSGLGVATDWIGMAFHGYSITHLDAPSHLFWNGKMYNGRPAGTVRTATGPSFGAVEAAREGIVSRGVLLDIPRHVGRDWLEPGEAVTPDVLSGCEAKAGVHLESGDILLVRTGRDARRAVHGPHDPVKDGNSGLDACCLPWLHERSVAMLGSDVANDVTPSGYSLDNPVHAVGMVAMGLWLIDNAYLEDLAEACARLGRWEFELVVAPLRLKNTTGSPVNPIAIL